MITIRGPRGSEYQIRVEEGGLFGIWKFGTEQELKTLEELLAMPGVTKQFLLESLQAKRPEIRSALKELINDLGIIDSLEESLL